MSVHGFFVWFQGSAAGHALRESDHLVGAGLQELHIIGFLLLLAAVLLVNLRLFGVGLRQQSIPVVANAASKLLWVGVIIAVTSGVLIFLSGPIRYLDNEAFVYKMALLIVAVIFQLTLHKMISKQETPAQFAGKSVATLSLLLWFGVSIGGRAIGFI